MMCETLITRSTGQGKCSTVGDSRRHSCEIHSAPAARHGAGEGSRPAGPHPARSPVPVHPPSAVRRATRDEHR